MHMGVMTWDRFQKAAWDKKKKEHFSTCQTNPSVYISKYENCAIKEHTPYNPFKTSVSVNRLFHIRYKTHTYTPTA